MFTLKPVMNVCGYCRAFSQGPRGVQDTSTSLLQAPHLFLLLSCSQHVLPSPAGACKLSFHLPLVLNVLEPLSPTCLIHASRGLGQPQWNCPLLAPSPPGSPPSSSEVLLTLALSSAFLKSGCHVPSLQTTFQCCSRSCLWCLPPGRMGPSIHRDTCSPATGPELLGETVFPNPHNSYHRVVSESSSPRPPTGLQTGSPNTKDKEGMEERGGPLQVGGALQVGCRGTDEACLGGHRTRTSVPRLPKLTSVCGSPTRLLSRTPPIRSQHHLSL